MLVDLARNDVNRVCQAKTVKVDHLMQVEKFKELGIPDDAVEVHEYEGLGHRLSPKELLDLCMWLEKVIPALE